MKVRKNLIVAAVSAIIMLILMSFLLPTFRFGLLALMRGWAAECGYDQDYLSALAAISSFAKESDYQAWLVSCGSTITGKIVRFVLIVLQTGLFFLSSLAFSNNVRSFRKKTARYLRKKFLNKKRRYCNK